MVVGSHREESGIYGKCTVCRFGLCQRRDILKCERFSKHFYDICNGSGTLLNALHIFKDLILIRGNNLMVFILQMAKNLPKAT